MSVFIFISSMFDLVNAMLDIAFLWGGLIVLLIIYPVYFFSSNLNKYLDEHRGQELMTQTFLLFLIDSGIALIFSAPEIIWLIGFSNLQITWNDLAPIFSSVRLGLVLIAFFIFSYFLGHTYGKNRWFVSAIGHIFLIFVGWNINYWMGIVFISAPLLMIYYSFLLDLALIVMPTSNPDDKDEQRKRINAFIAYSWGMQSPFTVVDGHAWKKYEPRIMGDITWEFSEFPFPFINKLRRPGLIWTKSHQVAAISGGTKFKRIDGPGVVFTGKLERLEQVIDLRLQLRTNEIEAVSKDGVRFIPRYFVAFRIDNEEWTKNTYDNVRSRNHLLRGANNLSYRQGSFPYSHLRVQAVLGKTSTTKSDNNQVIYWDQWAMTVIEDQTRKVLSQKRFDELWRPSNDSKFANAFDVIAWEIKKNSELILRSEGILLVSARVVNVRFYEEYSPDFINAMETLNTFQNNFFKYQRSGEAKSLSSDRRED